ncbi:unnamed protein product [Eruca vesicaria subsp. sativa]|uniref:Uncharacterized protein n=1 Tax=Eruca vesicaria subsp. sativa TaxID=29727 RepID=A0ABC8JP88_ERUVS|nr:unnamed protein product [Eruca vesicaria subsp. sativa]
MVMSNINNRQSIHSPQPDTKPSALERLGPSSSQLETHQSLNQRPSALERISSPSTQTMAPAENTTTTSIKKRLGRPPGRRNQPTLSLGVVSLGVKKRKVAHVKGSPKRRPTTTKAPRAKAAPKNAPAAAGQRPSYTIIPPAEYFQ